MGKMNPGVARYAYYKRQRGHKRDTCNKYWYYQIKHLRTKTGYFLPDDCYDYVDDAQGLLDRDMDEPHHVASTLDRCGQGQR